MKRILLMVIKNILHVPYWFFQICYYAKNSLNISDEKKLKLLKKIIQNANEKGNVKVETFGVENIPKDQSFMFFPNHQGLYDVLAILDGCPYFFSVIMKKELANVFFLKQVFQIMGAYSIDREDLRQSMTVIQQVSQEVKNGRNFLIFPEGTRSKHGNKIGEFKGGSFKSATKAKCPIVPVAIINSYKVFDTNSTKSSIVQVHYLEPLYYEDYKMMKTTEIAQLVSERIQKKIEKVLKSS